MRHPPVVLSIAGKPAAERYSLAAGVVYLLGGEQQVATLSLSDYRKYDRDEAVKQKLTEAHPAGIRLEILEQHLGLLKRGEAVLRPAYNRQSGVFEPAVYVEPRPFVVVDGELGIFTQGLRSNLDLRVFYSTEDSVMEWQEGLADDAEAYIESQRKWADMVVARLLPAENAGAGDMALTLRPTLPRLALQELLQSAVEQQGLRLELARDMGMPVDRIVIDAAITGQAAAYYEQRLQAEMPSEYCSGSDRAEVNGGQSRSESLVLTQLLVALHLLKTASG